MEIGPERRRAERFPMRMPVSFDGGSGTMRDFSGMGVYFETDYPFEIGSEITFTLIDPEAVNVHCSGRIVRVDPMREHFGVAATIDSYAVDRDVHSDAGRRPHIIIEQLRKHQP